MLNQSFPAVCYELGLDFPVPVSFDSELFNTKPTLTCHELLDKSLAQVYWTLSRCHNDNGYSGYLLIGKIVIVTEAQQPLSQIVDMLRALPCAVFTKDLNGYCLSANKYQAEMAGFKHEKNIIGKSDYDLPWYSDAVTIRQGNQRVMTENKTILLEEKGTLADGKKNIFLVTKSPFRDTQGKLIGVAGTSINISNYQQDFSFEEVNNRARYTTHIDMDNLYLTKRELECIKWMIKGKSSVEMAHILKVSKRTIEAHMNNIKKKFKCQKQFQIG